MRRILWIAGAALVGAVLASGLAAWRANPVSEAHPPLPDGPRSVARLLLARPFTLQRGYEHEWRSERPAVTAGWLVVLEADPELLIPRDEREPVLYVGDQTAERVNVGQDSGRLVAVVPAPLGPDGNPAPALEGAPIWFGTPELPERVDASRIAAERRLAERAGIAPRPSAEVAAALQAGGPVLAVHDRGVLRRHAAALVQQYSPSERDLVSGILAPLVETVR